METKGIFEGGHPGVKDIGPLLRSTTLIRVVVRARGCRVLAFVQIGQGRRPIR